MIAGFSVCSLSSAMVATSLVTGSPLFGLYQPKGSNSSGEYRATGVMVTLPVPAFLNNGAETSSPIGAGLVPRMRPVPPTLIGKPSRPPPLQRRFVVALLAVGGQAVESDVQAGLAASSDTMCRAALCGPTVPDPGVNRAVKVAVPPTGTVCAAPVTVNAAALVPVAVTELISSGVVPELVTTTGLVGLVLPLTPENTSSETLVEILPAPAVSRGLTLRTISTASWKSVGVSTSSGATM